MFPNIRKTFFFKRIQDGGFSLIELLVMLGVIGVLLGGGILNLRRLNERRQVEGAARLVEIAIRTAQKRASAGVKPPGTCDAAGQTLSAYRAQLGVIPLNNRQYRIGAICAGPADTVWGVTKTLESPLQFTTGAQIDFDFEERGKADGNYTLCVQNTKGSYFFQIIVNSGGAVRINKVTSC